MTRGESPDNAQSTFSHCLVCMLAFVVPDITIAAPPLHGDPAVLRVVRDAQATNAASFPRGRIVANVEETTLERRIVAKAEVIWDGEKTYWEYSLEEFERATAELATSQSGVRMVETPRDFFWYAPSANLLQNIPDKSSGYPDILKLRPEEVWFCFQRREHLPWSKVLDPEFVADAVEELEIAREEHGDFLLTRRYKKGTVWTIVAAPSAGGNIVHYERSRNENAPPGVYALGASGDYEWRELPDGRFYLTSCHYKEYAASPDDPVFEYRLSVEEFDPDPSIPRDQFAIAGLGVKPGTVVEVMGPEPRVYRYGQASVSVSEQDLERLVEQARSTGFAAPAREKE